jgi:hypothetical protein
MKFKNTVKAFVPVGSRESIPPFGLSRDFTADEVAKSAEIRHAQEKGYLIPWDGKAPLPAAEPPKKALYFNEDPGDAGATVRKKTATGKIVEYISATEVGVDDVQTLDQADGVVASIDGKPPLEYIEKGVDASKPVWKNASDAFEAELQSDTTQNVEFDDDDTITEQEDDREEALDVDHAIEQDASQFVRSQGKMGAEVTTVREMVTTEVGAANAAVAQATAPDLDNGEAVDGARQEVAELLQQPFSAKKWMISKTSDSGLLQEIASTTKSQNVKSLAQQRLSEIDKAA